MMNQEKDFIPISALQHYVYCPRQCALIHLECWWTDNQATAAGKIFHERADAGETTRKRNKCELRSLHIASQKYRITGIADVVLVEYVPSSNRIASIIPVEYKVGQAKKHIADEVQLCAQAFCLEEIFQISIHEGRLFYGRPKRNYTVMLDEQLRKSTQEVIEKTHQLFAENKTPLANFSEDCRKCSLVDYCMPQVTSTRKRRQQDLFSLKLNELLND